MLRKSSLIFAIMAISIALFWVNAEGQLQRPTPGPGIKRNPPQINSSDKRGTEQSPLIVKTINPPMTQAEADQERKDREEKSSHDRWLVRFTGLLFVATVILACVAIWQGRQLKRSVDSLCRSERAYIFVKIEITEEEKPIFQGTNVIKIPSIVEIIITNHGKTPAILMDYRNLIFVDKEDVSIEQVAIRIRDIFDSQIPSGTVIIDSKKRRSLPGNVMMTDEQRREITTLVSTMFCLGRIKYKDIFGKTWETGFCWKYEPFRAFVPIENLRCTYHT